MSFDEETECTTACYHCLDPIENFRIRVALQPVKNLYIPLPQFDLESTSPDISSEHEENEFDVEEYTFKWQERIFSSSEIKEFSTEADWKKKISEKYHSVDYDALQDLRNYPKKLFSYVDADNFFINEKNLDIFLDGEAYYSYLNNKINKDRSLQQNVKHFKNIPKRKVVNYCPSDEFKKRSHFINQNVQRMYIMVDLGHRIESIKKDGKSQNYKHVLCILSYNKTSHMLEVTPSFSKNQRKPYVIGIDNQDARNSFYYWLYHASSKMTLDGVPKENQIINEILDNQKQLNKYQTKEDFHLVEPDHLWVTLLVEIECARDFEHDLLYIQFFIKSDPNWICSDEESLFGTTVSSLSDSYGVCHFCHIFELNFLINLKYLEGTSSRILTKQANNFTSLYYLSLDVELSPPELFLEVLSLDKYSRYRSEGYTYITIPSKPGIFNYTLKCWRAKDRTIKSQLERFFTGGGPELEDVSYVGLKNSDREDVISRFGFETIPSGEINAKICVLHQSEVLKDNKKELSLKRYVYRLDANSLLGSVNVVLEAFRKARERMILAKKSLETISDSQSC